LTPVNVCTCSECIGLIWSLFLESFGVADFPAMRILVHGILGASKAHFELRAPGRLFLLDG
jgi:hypothetical protein